MYCYCNESSFGHISVKVKSSSCLMLVPECNQYMILFDIIIDICNAKLFWLRHYDELMVANTLGSFQSVCNGYKL